MNARRLLFLLPAAATLSTSTAAFALFSQTVGPERGAVVPSISFDFSGAAKSGGRQGLGGRSRALAPLSAKSGDDGDGNDVEEESKDLTGFWSNFLLIEEPRLLAVDLISLLIVCQLLGFADAVLAPEFVSKGGFLQPVTFPTTLGLMMRRDAEMSLAWVLACMKNGGYRYASILDDETTIRYALNTFTDYCILRVTGALAVAVALGLPVDGGELLRQVWFTVGVMCAFRLFYARNNPVY